MSRRDAEVNREKVIDNLYLYVFTYEHAKLQDTITVIVQDNQALLIDTAYPEYAERVKGDLEGQGIEPKIVVLSHYHSDHVSGCSVFSDCEVYASEFYEYNYNNCQVWEPGYTYVRPSHLVRHGDTLCFGDFRLKFTHAPGHSRCSMITRITDRIIHVGDLIMMIKDKKASLPFIADGGDFAEHIDSLGMIKKIEPDIILVPHGGMVKSRDEINKMVDDRVYYLEKTSISMGTLPLPACLMNDISDYDHLEFHDTNLIRLL